MLQIKVCGLKQETNIKALSQLPIDYMGFIFYNKSPRFIDNGISFDFIRTLPEHIKKVGVFVNEPSYSIINSVAHYNLDLVQLHGDETVKTCLELKPYVKIIKAVRVSDEFDFNTLEEFAPVIDHFLFDTDTTNYGGSGKQFNWELLKKYCLNKSFFLSGGISIESSAQLNEFHHPLLKGIDINSKFETEPGIKDIEKIKAFITKL